MIPPPNQPAPGQHGTNRPDIIGQLARAAPATLEAAWARLDDVPAHRWLRPAQTGMVMVRGRAGGTGQPFNLGEITATRAVAVLESDPPRTGFGYVAGRDHRHAELVALFDALMQDPAWEDRLRPTLLRQLAEDAAATRARRAAEIAPTRVDFATMVRGDV